MEELLKQIITRLDRMEDGQQQITQRLDRMEDGQQQITQRLDRMEDGQQQITQRLDHMEDGQKELKSEVKSLREEMRLEFKNLKEADSAILGLIEKTYKKAEQIDTVADDINFLLQRNAKHDNEIRELRKAL